MVSYVLFGVLTQVEYLADATSTNRGPGRRNFFTQASLLLPPKCSKVSVGVVIRHFDGNTFCAKLVCRL